ncbi:unnamed protein product [Cylicostephanus goldi]|uniref:Potassium channel tetramerisation-type BTB domain-containing protein n=1 Tax=Cylicostephanus goldi TaxID=71465 RepID=A0A3P6TIK6_CYLGO|nr:unnamed protein product [Cylicostephanus goldi]
MALVDGCDPITGEYYLERNSRIADHIVDFFTTGSLHKPQNMCIEKFKEELAYWRISTDHVSSKSSYVKVVRDVATTSRTFLILPPVTLQQ